MNTAMFVHAIVIMALGTIRNVMERQDYDTAESYKILQGFVILSLCILIFIQWC